MLLDVNMNILAYVVSVVVYYFIGFIWYSFLFAKPWQKESGVVMEKDKKVPIGAFIYSMGGQLVASALYALGVSMVVRLGNLTGVQAALLAGLSIIIFFVIPINSGNLLFANKKKLFLIDAGYQAVGAVVMALILTLWR